MAENLNDILAEQLRDVHLPQSIGWWPPAIGWWLVATIMLFGLSLLIFLYFRNRRQNRYRQLAMRELQTCYASWLQTGDSSEYLQSANAILKRAVLCLHDASALAGVSGLAWIKALNERVCQPFSASTGTALAIECYQAQPAADIAQVHQQVCQWLQSHSRKPVQVGTEQHA